MKKLFTLLTMLVIGISGMWAQITAQLVSGYGDPLTLNQFKALAGKGTSGRFAFVASSNTAADNAPRCDHWCKFTNTYNTTTLDEDAVFFLEEGTGSQAGQYRVKRSSDNKYVQTSTSATSFVESGGSYFKLVNRDPSDPTKAVTGDKSISFEDPSNSSLHYNANAVKYNDGAGAWTTYAVFGPLYIVTINCIDSKTKETFKTLENIIVRDGFLPSFYGYELTADPTSGAGIKADGTYNFEYEEEPYAINFSKATTYSEYRPDNPRYIKGIGLRIDGYSDQLLETGYTSYTETTNYKDLTSGTKLVARIGQTVTPIWKQKTNAMYGWVYIDLNNDGDFRDEGEYVGTSSKWENIEETSLSTSNTFVIPNVTPGNCLTLKNVE